MYLIPISCDGIIFLFLLYSRVWQPTSYLVPQCPRPQAWCFRGVGVLCPFPAQAACGPCRQLESGPRGAPGSPGAWQAPLQACI